MSYSRRSSSCATSNSPHTPTNTPKKRRGDREPSWLHPPAVHNSDGHLEHWENDFFTECRARSMSPSNRELNDWSMQLVEEKFQRMHLGLRGNKDLAREWREYYKGHLAREFPISDELPPRWMVAAMRPIDNSGRYSPNYTPDDQWNYDMEKDRGFPSSYERTPEWMADAMRPVDHSGQYPSNHGLSNQYDYDIKRESYSPDSSYRTRSSASSATYGGPRFIKTEDAEDAHSLRFYNGTRSIKTEEVEHPRSLSFPSSTSYAPPRYSRSPPDCKRECDEKGNHTHCDPDVYYGAVLLTKLQRGIPF